MCVPPVDGKRTSSCRLADIAPLYQSAWIQLSHYACGEATWRNQAMGPMTSPAPSALTLQYLPGDTVVMQAAGG
jgi:hypothetical protein